MEILIRRGVIIFSGLVHFIVGIIIWVSFPNLNFIAVAVGSLFPDSDCRQAAMGKVLPLWIFFKHRGATHTVWFAIFLSLLLGYTFNSNIAYSFFIGYASHIILDTIKPKSRSKRKSRR